MRSNLAALAPITLGLALIGGGEAIADPQPAAPRMITAPSGSHPGARASECKAEVDRKKLQGNARQAFYKSCLASAAPVTATGSKDHPAKPTRAKTSLEGLTDAPPH